MERGGKYERKKINEISFYKSEGQTRRLPRNRYKKNNKINTNKISIVRYNNTTLSSYNVSKL